MNNKGFGIINILIFAIFAILAIFVFYTFVMQIVGIMPSRHIPNYTNEYSKYFKSAISNDVSYISNNNRIEEYTSYDDIEDSTVNATKRYIVDYYSTLFDNDPLYINLTTLQSYGYISTIMDINNSSTVCTGYTKVLKNGNNVTYNPYINCGSNYTTEGYISRLDK